MKATTMRTAPRKAAGMAIENVTAGAAVFPIESNGSLFIPFGDYWHRNGNQAFSQTEAAAMVSAFRNSRGQAGRSAASVPVHIGTAGVPGSNEQDRSAYGWASGMAVEKDGLRIAMRWGTEGRRMLANSHFRFFAPVWEVVKRGKALIPATLVSVGLTNDTMLALQHAGNATAAAHEGDGGKRRDARSAAVTAELQTMKKGLPETQRRTIAWNRAAAKQPDLFSH